MKKAFLVGFSPRTRVVVNIHPGRDPEAAAALAAMERICSNPEGYITEDNIDEITEDTECPYPCGKERARLVEVDWETDGEETNLPKQLYVPGDMEDGNVADWLSDNYGFLVNSWKESEDTPKWDFRYDEEKHDGEEAVYSGIVSNGRRFLFFRAFTEETGGAPRCHIHDSLLLTPESEVCSYPWTPDNDSALLQALNSLGNPDDCCGEGSPLRTMTFPDKA